MLYLDQILIFRWVPGHSLIWEQNSWIEHRVFFTDKIRVKKALNLQTFTYVLKENYWINPALLSSLSYLLLFESYLQTNIVSNFSCYFVYLRLMFTWKNEHLKTKCGSEIVFKSKVVAYSAATFFLSILHYPKIVYV